MSMRGIAGRTVNVKRTELLNALRRNKEIHIAEFKEATEDFKKALIAELQKNLRTVRRNRTRRPSRATSLRMRV